MSATPISADQAKDMIDRGDSIVFVDARNPVAWGSSKEKLPGAVRMPIDEVDAHLGEVPRNATAITYCT